MNQARILPLILAGALQVMPFLRATIPIQAQGLAQSSWAVVLRLATGAVALFGYHAISGATTIVAPYTINGTNGKAITRQLSVSGQTAHSWSTTTASLGSSSFPLVPGVTLSSSGFISGTPTQAGTNSFVITAWEFTGNSGRNMSQTFTLNITGTSPPVITKSPQNATAAVGATASFAITASGAALSYQWSLGGSPITGATNATLSLTNIQTTSAGIYRIVVSNSGGSATNSAVLIVVSRPVITSNMQDSIVAVGASVNLSPGVGGSAATAQWYVNNNIITNATSLPLSLSNLQAAQTGLYSVVLTNIAGAVTNSAQLLVVPPPYPSIAPRLTPIPSAGRTIIVGFPTVAGYRYVVQFADRVSSTNWVTLTNIAPALSSGQVSIPPQPSSNGFFRVLMSN